MTTIYHVAPQNHTGDILSLYAQHGDDAVAMFCERWPEAEAVAEYHSQYVHCYDDLAEARKHVNDGKIYAIDVDAMSDDCIDVERDVVEFDHPMVFGSIPAEYLTEIDQA